jgi:hypothetical protein
MEMVMSKEIAEILMDKVREMNSRITELEKQDEKNMILIRFLAREIDDLRPLT